jgi:hypothetical protein
MPWLMVEEINSKVNMRITIEASRVEFGMLMIERLLPVGE